MLEEKDWETTVEVPELRPAFVQGFISFNLGIGISCQIRHVSLLAASYLKVYEWTCFTIVLHVYQDQDVNFKTSLPGWSIFVIAVRYVLSEGNILELSFSLHHFI